MIVTQKEYYDYREDENTRQVSVIELLRCAFKKWQLILLAGILLGGLMGSYKILSIHSKKAEMTKAYDTYKTKLDAYNASAEEYKKTIADLQTSLEAKQKYISNSVKMNLDCYNCPVSFADVTVTSNSDVALTVTEINAITTAIYNEVYFGDSIMEVAEKTGVQSGTLRELMAVKLTTNTPTVRINTRAETLEEAEVIRDDLLDILVNEKANEFASLGDFKIVVVNKGTAEVFDAEIQAYQTAQREALSKLQTNLYNAQTQSSALTKPVAVDKYSKKYMLINGIKLGIVGFVAGAVLAIVALAVLVLRKGVILSADEIDGEFGLKTLADFSGKKANDPSQIGFMMARIENGMKGKDGREIGVVGSASSEAIESLTALLNEKAASSKGELKFVSVPDFNKNGDAFRMLEGFSGVILAEEIGKSDYLGIRKEVALIAESGDELLGTVYY